MIKITLIGIILLIGFLGFNQTSVQINFGTAPSWGPSGYTSVRYYYIPEIEAYYDVKTEMFFYISNGVWIQRNYLPTRYRNYDLYNGYKVVINNYYGDKPYHNYKHYKSRYPKGYKGHYQKTNGHNPKFKQHPSNNQNHHQPSNNFKGNNNFQQQKSKSPSPSNNPNQNNQHKGNGKKK
jgi:hypothetical protein